MSICRWLRKIGKKICELKWYLLFCTWNSVLKFQFFVPCHFLIYKQIQSLIILQYTVRKKLCPWKKEQILSMLNLKLCAWNNQKTYFCKSHFRRMSVKRCTRIYNLIKDRCCCLKFTFPRPFCKIKIHVSLLFEEVLSTLFYV